MKQKKNTSEFTRRIFLKTVYSFLKYKLIMSRSFISLLHPSLHFLFLLFYTFIITHDNKKREFYPNNKNDRILFLLTSFLPLNVGMKGWVSLHNITDSRWHTKLPQKSHLQYYAVLATLLT